MAHNRQKPRRRLATFLGRLLLLVCFPVFLVFASLFLLAFVLYAVMLQLVIWICWCSRGVQVLVVYSESPHWQGYFEQEMIPRLQGSAVALNWSQRRKWRRGSLAVRALHTFGGGRDFNPMVVVFRPFRWAKAFRFRGAFQEHKHGKVDRLRRIEGELFEYLERAGVHGAR
jgi:hypothetical protein